MSIYLYMPRSNFKNHVNMSLIYGLDFCCLVFILLFPIYGRLLLQSFCHTMM